MDCKVPKLVVISLAAGLVLSGCVDEKDKQRHFVAGAATSGLVKGHTGSWKLGCASAVGIGVAKEAYDKYSKKGTADRKDILATAAGCLVWTIKF